MKSYSKSFVKLPTYFDLLKITRFGQVLYLRPRNLLPPHNPPFENMVNEYVKEGRYECAANAVVHSPSWNCMSWREMRDEKVPSVATKEPMKPSGDNFAPDTPALDPLGPGPGPGRDADADAALAASRVVVSESSRERGHRRGQRGNTKENTPPGPPEASALAEVAEVTMPTGRPGFRTDSVVSVSGSRTASST